MTVMRMGGGVAERLIDVDEEDLTVVAEYLGTTTAQETLRAALREVILMQRRERACRRLIEIASTGRFDELLTREKHP